jgi:hypothetical protein
MYKRKLSAYEIDSQVDESAENGLTSHFSRISEGSKPTPRTPLFKNVPFEDVIRGWVQILDENLPRELGDFKSYEISRKDKTGPQGGFPPLEERMDDLAKYFNGPSDFHPDNMAIHAECVRETNNALLGSVRNKSIRLLDPSQVLARSIEGDKLNTNSGLPLFAKRNLAHVQEQAIADINSGDWETTFDILGSRSSRLKPRFIYMFPFASTIQDQRSLMPIMDTIREANYLPFAAWEGFDEVEDAFHQMEFFKNSKYIISCDYVKMDTTFTWEQAKHTVLDVLSPSLQPNAYELCEQTHYVNHHKETMISINQVVGNKTGNSKKSGDGWTNGDESISSDVFHRYLVKRLSLMHIFTGSAKLGDDAVLGFSRDPGNDFLNKLSELALSYGYVMNPDKQRVDSETCVYLQRFFSKHYKIDGKVVGMYPGVLALNTACNPERFHSPRKWNADMEILRWVMILENCHHHPLFHELIEYMAKGDIYDLGRNKPGFWRNIGNTYATAKALPGFVPTYTEAHANRSIYDFETVKYLTAS